MTMKQQKEYGQIAVRRVEGVDSYGIGRAPDVRAIAVLKAAAARQTYPDSERRVEKDNRLGEKADAKGAA